MKQKMGIKDRAQVETVSILCKGPVPMTELAKSIRLINEKSPYLLKHAHNPVD